MSQSVIRGYSGQYFDYNNPDAYNFTIEEFAHSLSKLCRFAGHCTNFYSVAQHSVLVSYIVPEVRVIQLQGLLHDAAESFMSDLPSPLKYLIAGNYREIEGRVERAIFRQFDLPEIMDDMIHTADKYILSAERRDLLQPDSADGWDPDKWPEWMIDDPTHATIHPLPHEEAQLLFTNRAEELTR
jgi:hypothetical protein